MENNEGKFSISSALIDDNRHALRRDLSHAAVRAIMGKCVITECHYDLKSDTYVYTAFSPLFDVLGEGEATPTYAAVVGTKGESLAISFVRKTA